MQKHVTLLRVKAAAEQSGQRWVEGWATTSATDRVGDQVLPGGAEYRLPLVLLFAHDHQQPIGAVEHATATSAGIRIRARLTPGVARADEIWTLLQDGAPLALSIGFQALASEPLPGGGLRFTRWSWYELSIVSVPANPEARLTVGKGLVQSTSAAPAPQQYKASAHEVAGFDGELFGEAVGKAIVAVKAELLARIKVLEQQRGMSYCGDWQPALSYRPGDVVRHAGAVHVLAHEAKAGTAPRDGSAWQRLTKGV